MTFGFTTIS